MNEAGPNVSEQRLLLDWARQAVENAVFRRGEPFVDESCLTDYLRAPRSVFVTLKKRGELRGCIGLMDLEKPLWRNLLRAAASAALEDARFSPVQPEELPELRLEISVLEPARNLERIEDFDPLQHGIMVERGWNHALLLPKVAQEYGWSARQVLEAVCEKAGLSPDAWQVPGVQLKVFTAVNFAEESGTENAGRP